MSTFTEQNPGRLGNIFRIDSCPPYRGRAGRSLSLAMLFASLLLSATTANATPVRVDTLFQGGGTGNPTVSTEAFFDDALRGGPGSGIILIPIDVYTLVFSNFGPALADLSGPSSPLSATYNNGTFQYISGFAVPFVSPPSPTNFSNFAIEPPGLNRLILRFRISGRNNFDLVSQSGVIPVPEPNTLVLVGVGLFGLTADARRRRRIP
jgi:hypothetical protein